MPAPRFEFKLPPSEGVRGLKIVALGSWRPYSPDRRGKVGSVYLTALRGAQTRLYISEAAGGGGKRMALVGTTCGHHAGAAGQHEPDVPAWTCSGALVSHLHAVQLTNAFEIGHDVGRIQVTFRGLAGEKFANHFLEALRHHQRELGLNG